MERYGVYSISGQDGLFVLLQYPGLEASKSVVVAPMVLASSIAEIPVLTPRVQFSEEDHLVLFTRLAAIPLSALGKLKGSLTDFDYAFQRAHQRLFFGN